MAPSDTRVVGRSVGRLDGRGKVDGSALYVDDVPEPDAWHGATIRSSIAAGTLERIEWDPGFDWSQVVRVTAADLPRLGARNGVQSIDDSQPALVEREILHVAEPVALVAAPTQALLRQAIAHVRLIEKPAAEPPVLSLDAAIERDTEVMCRLNITKGDALSVLAAAESDDEVVVIEGTYRTGHHEQLYIEPCGMVGRVREEGGVEVHGSLQCPYYVHKALAHMYGLPPEHVVVVADVTGGGFGGKEEYPSMLGAHTTLLALAARRPVKIVYDREEDMIATTKRHPVVERIRMAFKGDGTLVAVHADIEMDTGAYLTLTPVVLSRAILHAAGPYRCSDVLLDARARFTNTPPNGAFRGFGVPQSVWTYERLTDRAAAVLGVDVVDLRRLNHLREGDSTATGQALRWSVGSTAVLDRVMEVSDFSARRERAAKQRAEAQACGTARRRGVGFSFFHHGAGFTGAGEVRLRGRADVMLSDGGNVRVLAASTDIGQGTRTIFPQITAEELGLPLERVEVEDVRTDRVPDSGPTVASRSCMVVGRVVQEAARDLGRQLSRRLEQRLELAAGTVVRRGAEFFEAGESGKRLATWDEATRDAGPLRGTFVYEHPEGIEFDEAAYVGDAYPVFGWGANVIELEVDIDTGAVHVASVWTAHDVGRAINPMIVAGQIEGGVLQGIGWALCEEVVMQDGRMANPRMSNYIIPTSLDAPEMVTEIVESSYFHGPFGAKGCGELPMNGPGPAVAAAVEDAIGHHFTELPMTPERILAALDVRADEEER